MRWSWAQFGHKPVKLLLKDSRRAKKERPWDTLHPASVGYGAANDHGEERAGLRTSIFSPTSITIKSSPSSNGPEYVLRVGGIRSCSVAVGRTICEYTASFGFVRENTSPACSGVM